MNQPLHKILLRQMNKYLPENMKEDGSLTEFLNSVNEYYYTFDRDKRIAEHAFAVSEREYQEVVLNLQQQYEIKQKSIQLLKETVLKLDPSAMLQFTGTNDDILLLIDFLKFQIHKTKELEITLIEAKDQAEHAAHAKGEFLSVMSHEIRTPLNAIIGYIHLLLLEDPLPSQQEYLNILQISARNLLSLINDVLDFNKIEEGKIIFAESDFDVRKLVNDVKLANKIRADENGNILKVKFDDELPRYLKGDITRITQILNNLVSNAIKFTKNGKITIELEAKQIIDNRVEIYFSVSDTGIGISEEHQKNIFEKFTQAHKYITREFGGTGLGLAIIKRLLELMDSEIKVDSTLGSGSNFHFTIWFEKSDIQIIEDITGVEAKEDLGGVRVLLVEDVEFNAKLAKIMLSKWNAQVTIACNGVEAIEKAKAEEFDIILMDVQMPIMDGFTASEEIRKLNIQTPIYPLTASTSMQMQARFNVLGINEFVYKPINPDSLHKTILKSILRSKQS